MKINISKETYEERWVEYDGCEILIKPYPVGLNDVRVSSDQNIIISGDQRKKIFMESVKGWRNLTDSNDNEIPCTKVNKDTVFNFNLGGIGGFVYQYNSNFESTMRAELENLQSGQDGISIPRVNPAMIAEDK